MATTTPWNRGLRLVAAMAMVAATAVYGAGPANAATSIPTLALVSTSIPRGDSTDFTSTFEMDEGVAQATLNLGTKLSGTFTGCTATPVTPGPGPFSCTAVGGAVTVSDGAPAVTRVSVVLTGTIDASRSFGFTSGESSATMSTEDVPNVSITLNQGVSITSSPQTVTVTANTATDANVAITTTAPASTPGGVNAQRGTDVTFSADLTRGGTLAQETNALATLTPVGTGPHVGTLPPPQAVKWTGNQTLKSVSFTVNVPLDTPVGGTGTYQIVVTYDPFAGDGAQVAPFTNPDTEVGASRTFTVTNNPSTDAIVSLVIDGPTNGGSVPRGTNVDYLVTLNRTGKTNQTTVVDLSLVPVGDARGTTVPPAIEVFFATGDLSESRTITVTVPPGADLGSVEYRFKGVYDPTTGPPTPTTKVDTVFSDSRSFNVVLARPTLALVTTPAEGTVINRSTPAVPSTMELKATITNPLGAAPLTTGVLTIDVPAGMKVTPGSTAPDALVGPTVTPDDGVLPAGDAVGPAKVTVTYALIPAGASRTLTVPTTILGTATKKDGADLFIETDFVGAPAPLIAGDPLPPPVTLSDDSEFELRADADLRMIVTRPSATDQLDPDEVSMLVTYAVENLGPDPAAGTKFVVKPPDGFVGSVNPNENGSDWACTNTTAGPNPADITCTYQPAFLNPGVTTTAVGITWTFNTIGAKVFTATASSNTVDPVPGNNTPVAADVTTTISKPTAGVTITAAATPDPVVVASDDPAEVSVTYLITNNGPKNVKAQITVVPPAGATLLTLSGVGTCTPVLPTGGTTASTTCSLGTLQKPTGQNTPPPLTVVATYSVPQSVFLASGAPYTATLSASIAPVDGGTFSSECPAPPTPAPAGCSITSASDTVTGTKADLRMNVSAPATARLDPSDAFPAGRVEVPVEYTVTNLGPQGAATVTFTATAPDGQATIAVNPVEANLPGGGNPGPAWICTDIAGGVGTTTCTYQGNPLASGATTPRVTITWTLATPGDKDFVATASTTTFDTNLANNTPDPAVDTMVESPLGEVRITATATPDPAPVAADAPASVSVTYAITNAGPGNVRAEITLAPPTGATLKTVTGAASCDPAVPNGGTTGSTTCSLGNLQKPGPQDAGPTPKNVTVTYEVPKSVFLASVLYQATFSATIAPTNGGSFGTACANPANPTPGCSINSASDTVTGAAPIIDIGLAEVTVPPLVNVNDNAALPTVARTITYQNWSTALPVRANTAFIDLTIPAAPAPSIGIPAQCAATPDPTIVRCAIAAEVAKATNATTPGTQSLTLQIPLQTALNVPLEVRAVVNDPTTETAAGTTAPNRVAASGGEPDLRAFALDLNRRPSVTTDIGPGVPAGGTFTSFPIPLHNDDDGDLMKVVMPTPSISCGAPAANCVVTGGSADNLSVTTAADRLTVSHTGTTPADPAVPVTVEVSYLVDDEKGVDSTGVPSSSTSKLRFKLLPAVAQPVDGSFGDRPENNPTSFGGEVTDAELGPVASDIPVLVGARGTDANGGDFPDVDTYAITAVGDPVVDPSTAVVGAAGNIVYTPAPGFTSDPPVGGPPADSFSYTATGKKGADTIFTVTATATIEVPNQLPIGVDGELTIVPNTGPKNTLPLVNDIDGNTVAAPIAVPGDPGSPFAFDHKNSLQIVCIGPLPPVAELETIPSQATCDDPAKGMKPPGEVLTIRALDDSGAITAVAAKTTDAVAGTEAFRTVTITPDSSAAGPAPFVAIIVDALGGTAWSPIDAVVTNQPPEVIAGVPAVPKNSPPVEVIDTVDAGRDNNGDLVVISGFTQPEHGTVFVQDRTKLMYEPERDYVGPDSLILEVSDSRGTGSNQAQLNIDVVEAAAQPNAADAGGAGAGGGAPAGPLPATGGDPLPLTIGGAASLLLGFLLVQASKRRRSLPLLAGARHLRT